MTVREYAARAGLSEQRVRALCAAKRIPSRRVAARGQLVWMITGRHRPGMPGRPKKVAVSR
jgi:hypothetical protein